MLQRDDFAFADAVNPDEARTYGAGIHCARMLHERFAIDIHAPYFYVEADINAWLMILRHNNTGENGLMVLSKGDKFNGNMDLSNPLVKSQWCVSAAIQFCKILQFATLLLECFASPQEITRQHALQDPERRSLWNRRQYH